MGLRHNPRHKIGSVVVCVRCGAVLSDPRGAEVDMGAQSLPKVFEPLLGVLRERERAQESRARSALERLCKKGQAAGKGFDPNRLAFCLDMIRLVEDSKALGRTPEPLCYGEHKTERLTAGDLRRIAKQAQDLREDVRKLRLTNLVFEALVARRLSAKSVLAPQFTAQGKYMDEVDGLSAIADLPALWRWYRTTRFHGTDGSLWRLCQYVEQTTGSPNDSLLVEILEPMGILHCDGAAALKVWRSRIKKKVTPRRQKNTG